ncbi:unnamed protein product [Oikopleura dioica]|uniref:Uncharacterized protein n=1 Tax=Oikopleura dioica TaxID=34765 RepID=E4YI73_OIKDI|nr:unnamed protein product [Oikopleura dioica]
MNAVKPLPDIPKIKSPMPNATGEGEKQVAQGKQFLVEGRIQISHIIECNDDVFCCKVSPSSKLIAVCTNKGLVIIYRVSDGRKLHQLVDTDTRQKNLPAVTCHWINDDKLVAGYCDGKIKVWNVSNQQCLKTIEEDRTVYQTMVTPTKDALVTAGKDSDINVYDLDTLQKINTCKASPSLERMDGHRTAVYALKHHPNETWNFISGGWDDTVQFWDRRQERATKRIFGPHICGESIDIDPKEHTILTASWRRHDGIQVWDYREGTLRKTILEHPDERSSYYTAQFIGQDSFLVGGSNKNVFKVKDQKISTDLGVVSEITNGVVCSDKVRYQQTGDGINCRVAYGYSSKVAIADVADIDNHGTLISSPK